MFKGETVTLPDEWFKPPCTINLTGPSGSGKTTLLLRSLKRYGEQLFRAERDIHGLLYFYGEDQPIFDEYRQLADSRIHFHHGLPSREEFDTMISTYRGQHVLVVLDNLMSQVSNMLEGSPTPTGSTPQPTPKKEKFASKKKKNKKDNNEKKKKKKLLVGKTSERNNVQCCTMAGKKFWIRP